jgi:hypothetical protein
LAHNTKPKQLEKKKSESEPEPFHPYRMSASLDMPATDTIPTCILCKHFYWDYTNNDVNIQDAERYETFSKCKLHVAITNPITGSVTYRMCSDINKNRDCKDFIKVRNLSSIPKKPLRRDCLFQNLVALQRTTLD